jgi:ribosomal protein S18 acetylase RimI-like enzyme
VSGARDFGIRSAEPADAAALARLLRSQLDDHGIELADERLAAAVAGPLADPSLGFFRLAVRGGEAVGMAYVSLQWSLEHGGRAAWLEELWVDPPHRGLGVGEALLEAALAGARETGASAVDLEVESGHERVETLYLRHGFRRHERRRWFLAPLPDEPAD